MVAIPWFKVSDAHPLPRGGSQILDFRASSKAAPYRCYSLSAGGPKGAELAAATALWVPASASQMSTARGVVGWAVWQVVGVGGFPLPRAPVSPNGGVAGFKQTFSAVARM